MSRCLCGNIMSTQEMCQKQENGEYETLCSACLSEVANIDEPEEREYKFQDLTGRLFPDIEDESYD